MYNRYQRNQDFIAIDPDPEPREDPGQDASAEPADRAQSLLGEVSGGLSHLLGGLLRHFSLEKLDTGDILLVLIILFLYLEGDNLELIITLGLLLLLGLGEDD